MENLTDGITNMNLNELTNQPELIVSLKNQLIDENDKLKQKIEEYKTTIKDLQNKIPKDVYNEKFPLKTPEVLSTNRLAGDTLLKSSSKKDTEFKDGNTNQEKNKESTKNNKKDDNKPENVNKTKSGNKQVAKEPENDKIDSSRLNLLVGRVVEVSRHPDAEKLYVEKIDLGEDQPRTIVSGLVDYIDLDKFKNKLVVVLCNLKPSKLRGILSEGMVLCASDKENNKVELLEPPETSQPGDRIVFEKFPGTPDQQLNPKKKIWEQIAVDLKVENNRIACYKGDPFTVKDKGFVTTPTLSNTLIK